jgi:hypothetical protein
VNSELFLCFIKTFSNISGKGEAKIRIQPFLTPALDRDERSASYAGRVTPGTLWITQALRVSTGSTFLVQFVFGFTPFCFNGPYEFTLNLRSLILGLTAFGWLRVRVLSRT